MLTEILLIILIVLASVLVIYLFTTLRKLNRSIDVLSADMHQLIDSTIPVMNNLEKASEKLASIADEAEDRMNEVNAVIAGAKEKVASLKMKVKEGKKDNPVYNLVNNLNALSKGISAFWNKFNS